MVIYQVSMGCSIRETIAESFSIDLVGRNFKYSSQMAGNSQWLKRLSDQVRKAVASWFPILLL